MKTGSNFDLAAVESFLKRHGVLYREDFQLEPIYKIHLPEKSPSGPKMVETSTVKAGNHFKEDIGAFQSAQAYLRRAWSGDAEAISEHFNDGTLHLAFNIASFDILQNYSGTGEVVLETEDLWHYMRYLFLIDYAEQRTGICEREDCPTPYFIQQRKGQRYCSHDCAVLENVRRFRSKARTK